jgi:hypothetical protein
VRRNQNNLLQVVSNLIPSEWLASYGFVISDGLLLQLENTKDRNIMTATTSSLDGIYGSGNRLMAKARFLKQTVVSRNQLFRFVSSNYIWRSIQRRTSAGLTPNPTPYLSADVPE